MVKIINCIFPESPKNLNKDLIYLIYIFNLNHFTTFLLTTLLITVRT